MLKVRIIPTLLWKNFGLVKGIGFDSWRRVGSILPAVKVFNARQVDELIVVDITASIEKRNPDLEMVAEIAHECFVPLTIGGGITNIDQIKQLLRMGADKVSINSAAFDNPDLISDGAGKFGSQCIIASIDAVKGTDGRYYCHSHAGSKSTTHEVMEWAAKMEEKGAGEILLTDVALDGTMNGYNLELINNVSKVVKIPVIASGGAGTMEDFVDVFSSKGNADAALAASIFHFKEIGIPELKRYLQDEGIVMRL